MIGFESNPNKKDGRDSLWWVQIKFYPEEISDLDQKKQLLKKFTKPLGLYNKF